MAGGHFDMGVNRAPAIAQRQMHLPLRVVFSKHMDTIVMLARQKTRGELLEGKKVKNDGEKD